MFGKWQSLAAIGGISGGGMRKRMCGKHEHIRNGKDAVAEVHTLILQPLPGLRAEQCNHHIFEIEVKTCPFGS